MTQLVDATLKALVDTATYILEYPSYAGNFSNSLTTGPFTYDVSNYFYNSKILFTLDSDSWLKVVDKLNSTMQMSMFGAALGTGDYCILRDSSIAESDSSDTGEYYIDDSCYTVAYLERRIALMAQVSRLSSHWIQSLTSPATALP